MTDNDNKQLVIFALGIAGIVIGFFAYLIYTQNRERLYYQSTYQQLNAPSQVQPSSSLNNDKIIQLLESHQHQINDINYNKVSNEQVSQLLNNQQSQIDYILNTRKITQQPQQTYQLSDKLLNTKNLELPKPKVLKAGDVSNIRSTNNDKIRQTMFGMI